MPNEIFSSLSFDPGGATGFSYFSNQVQYDNPVFSGGTFTEKNHHHDIRHLIETYMPDYVICEDFQFRQKAGSEDYRKGLELVSREYIGILRMMKDDYNYEFILQPPNYKDTKLVRDENLDKLSLLRYPKHENRHYHDAVKHHLHWLIQKQRYQPYIDRIKSHATNSA